MQAYDFLNKADDGAYWYARGYYDGRAKGNNEPPIARPPIAAHAYKTGYDRGVADYCLEIDGEDGE